jgi:hypothetical protein
LAVIGLSWQTGLRVSNAQLTILHSFGDGTVSNDGTIPATGLIQAPDGNFYGTTAHQAQNLESGTVYRITTSGAVTVIQYFPAAGQKQPSANLLFYKGNLLGPALSSNTRQVLFRTKLSGQTVLWHRFSAQDGLFPKASLIVGSDGDLYGTAYGSGGTYFFGDF